MAFNTEQAFLNKFWTRLDADLTNSATSLTVTEGAGKLINAAIGSSKEMYLTIRNKADDIEIVKCTAVDGDTLTIERGQDGTTADDWYAGDIIDFRLTAAILESFRQQAVYRDIAYNPNGVLTGSYSGEEVRETGSWDCQNRWWKNTSAKRWKLIAGSACDWETEDDGLIKDLAGQLLLHWDDGDGTASHYDAHGAHVPYEDGVTNRIEYASTGKFNNFSIRVWIADPP